MGMLWPSRALSAIAMLLLAACGAQDSGPPGSGTPPAPLRAGAGRTAEVCLGPAAPPATCFTIRTDVIGGVPFSSYAVRRPGVLLFDLEKRRSELNLLEPRVAGRYCAAKPLADEAETLPAISFGAAEVTIFETPSGNTVRQSADVAFRDLRTSAGDALPHFGFILNQELGTSWFSLQYRPSIDPNVQGIPGLDLDYEVSVDLTTGQLTVSDMDTLPASVRRVLLAVAYHLPEVYGAATNVQVRAGNTQPLWTMQDLVARASVFRSHVFALDQPLFSPIRTMTCDENSCRETADLNRFRDYLIRYTGDYVKSNRRATAEGLLANLRSWAANGAMTEYPGFTVGGINQADFRPKYELQWYLLPLLQTWSVLKQDAIVTAADRTLIDGWLARLVAYATEPVGGPQNPVNPFNVGYLTRGVQMAWGILTGANSAVAEGMERVYMGLHQMRSDGSFPREVARGRCALRYQDVMLLNLIYLAELAAEQGYDAYALNVDGKSLHTAVTFLLDAVDDPSLVLRYASEDAGNCNSPGPGLETNLVREAPGGFAYSAWMEPYIARFPNHPNAVRLERLLTGGLSASRPVWHPHSGGNTTCFSANSKPQPSAYSVNCLFDWAGANYPTLLAGGNGKQQSLGPYYYRRFAATDSYLGVSSADQSLLFLSPASGMINLGPAAGWLPRAGCS